MLDILIKIETKYIVEQKLKNALCILAYYQERCRFLDAFQRYVHWHLVVSLYLKQEQVCVYLFVYQWNDSSGTGLVFTGQAVSETHVRSSEEAHTHAPALYLVATWCIQSSTHQQSAVQKRSRMVGLADQCTNYRLRSTISWTACDPYRSRQSSFILFHLICITEMSERFLYSKPVKTLKRNACLNHLKAVMNSIRE